MAVQGELFGKREVDTPPAAFMPTARPVRFTGLAAAASALAGAGTSPRVDGESATGCLKDRSRRCSGQQSMDGVAVERLVVPVVQPQLGSVGQPPVGGLCRRQRRK